MRGHRAAVWAALGLILAVALALRLWGIRQGLPYAYNSDEDAHFVPRAIGMLTLGWNPHYFANPPAYTDLLRLVFSVWFEGRAGVDHTFATNPTAVFTAARVAAALLGTLAVWLLYVAGARLLHRGVALLAAALEAVAFLPVFYAHLALNDVPTLAPLTLSLLGSAGVLRKGRKRDYLIAGIGLGLGCATKYTAGIVLAPLLAAAAAQYLAPTPRRLSTPDGTTAQRARAPGGAPPGAAPAARPAAGVAPLAAAPTARRSTPARPAVGPAAVGLALAGVAALVAFLVADPYSVLDLHAFEQGIAHQSSLSGEAQGKLGAPHQGGLLYYLWSLTWGLGWVPAVAALGGAVTIWWRERALGWMLVPAPLLYLAFMGSQGRYFGRWLLPIFPLLCLLAAFFALQVAQVCARRVPRLRTVLVAVAVLALCAQGIVYSFHSGLVLSRADTRALTRAWMVAHIPAGTPIVVEPVVPDEWVQDVGHPTLATAAGERWPKYQSLRSVIGPAGELRLGEPHEVGLENYELTLSPALIGYYERSGYCWVLSGYAESGRALADPARAPNAVAYYRALAHQAEVAYHVSPYHPKAPPVAFNFDWTFDYYPLAYERPGPEMTVYRLRGGRCGRA
ncbi:MAG TPA: glycosyltransferase family 39 protein [Solirubrobacteraceae bacterium]|nr:glycosyltransferase family 39 protein [Solirubrobacteraceae bacterium]